MNKQEGGIKDSLKSEVNAALENAAQQLIMFAALRILDLPHILKKPEGVMSRNSLERLFKETPLLCHGPSFFSERFGKSDRNYKS